MVKRDYYTDEERQTVHEAFGRIGRLAPTKLPVDAGVRLISSDPVIRGHEPEKVWLLFTAPTSVAQDRYTIYTRSREGMRDLVEFDFVPSFAFQGGAGNIGFTAEQRKLDFCTFANTKIPNVESLLGLGHNELVELTHQAWKGLSLRISIPLAQWTDDGFGEKVASRFAASVQAVNPLLPMFERQYPSR